MRIFLKIERIDNERKQMREWDIGILGVKILTKNFTGREKNIILVVQFMRKIINNKILNL